MSTQLLLFLRAWSVLIRYGQQCGWLVQDQHSTTMLRPTPCQSHFVQSGASSSSRTKGFQMDLFKASCIFCIYSLLNLFIFLGPFFCCCFFNKKIKKNSWTLLNIFSNMFVHNMNIYNTFYPSVFVIQLQHSLRCLLWLIYKGWWTFFESKGLE